MSRDPRYQKLLNSKRWKELRRQYLQAHPLCERCEAEGYVRSAVDLHHLVPVETGKTQQEMERLAFDIHNLRALCIPCHIATHKEMGKGTKDNRKEREEQRQARWLERIRAMSQPRNPAAPDFVQGSSDSEISSPRLESTDHV